MEIRVALKFHVVTGHIGHALSPKADAEIHNDGFLFLNLC